MREISMMVNRKSKSMWSLLSLLSFFLTQLCVNRVTCEMYQSSSPGEIAVMSFEVTLAGGDSECGSLFASGDLTVVNVLMYFDSHFYDFFDQAANMALQVQELDATGAVVQCFVYGGYDFNPPGCGKMGKWPEDWHTTNDGTYEAVANATRAHFSGNLWSICIGHGWDGAFFDTSYTGTFNFPSLLTSGQPPSQVPSRAPSSIPTVTHAPTQVSPNPTANPSLRPSMSPIQGVPTTQPSSLPDVMTVTSPCEGPITLMFNAYLQGTETVCVNFMAKGSLEKINMTMQYEGNDDEVAGDMTFLVYHSTSLYGVQVGGHDYYTPTVEYIGPWPDNWQSNVSGRYSAEVDVSSGNLGGADGIYYVCVLNGWYYGEVEHYSGQVRLDSLIMQCDETEVPSLAPSPDSALFASDDDGSGNEETMIIVAASLVPVLLIFTALVGCCMWRRRNNEKTSRQSMVTTELSEISKDVNQSARAMSTSQRVKQEDDSSDSDGDDAGDDDDDNNNYGSSGSAIVKASVEKQRLEAYKKHQKASTKKGSYEPPGIANPLLSCLEEGENREGKDVL